MNIVKNLQIEKLDNKK